MAKFAGNQAQSELQTFADMFLTDCHSWLKRHHPELLARRGDAQVLDTAVQGICRQSQERWPADPSIVPQALAHEVAILVVGQVDPGYARGLFETMVDVFSKEVADDLRPQGRG